MPVKYRKLFWLTVVLIAVSASTLAFVSARTGKVTPRVEEQSLLAAGPADKLPPSLGILKSPERK